MKKLLIILNLSAAVLTIPLLTVAGRFHTFNMAHRYKQMASSLMVESVATDRFLEDRNADMRGSESWRVAAWLRGGDTSIRLAGPVLIMMFLLNVFMLVKTKTKPRESLVSS